MKYYLILLVSTASLISVEGTIPDYIRVCKRNNPDLEACVKDSILNLRDKLIDGIPELAVPPIDPLHLDKLALNVGPGLKAENRDLIMTGAKNFSIHDLVVDIDGNVYNFTVKIPEITAKGIYEIDASVASIPLKGTGPFYFTADTITGRATLRGKKFKRHGKIYYGVTSLRLKLQVGNYNVKLHNLFGGQPTIGEATNKLLNEEKSEILSLVLPVMEKAISEYILLAGNNICKHFTWDELFPES